MMNNDTTSAERATDLPPPEAEIRKALEAGPTPGPWRWEINLKSKGLHLVGGKPQFDLTIMDFTRWGMGDATMRLRDTAHDGMNIMHKPHDRPEWIEPFTGREHHYDWCANVTHPDAAFIAACNPKAIRALLDELDELRGRACIEAAQRGQVAAPVAPVYVTELSLKWLADRSENASIVTRLTKRTTEENTVPLYAGAPPVQGAAPATPGLTDAQIDHLWDIHVGEPVPKYPLTMSDWRNFARAVLAAAGVPAATEPESLGVAAARPGSTLQPPSSVSAAIPNASEALRKLVRLQDQYLPDAAPHEWTAAWDEARVILARGEGSP